MRRAARFLGKQVLVTSGLRLLFIWLLLALVGAAEPASLRVGILSFEDTDDLPRQLRQQSAALRRSLGLTATFAIGTYAEIFHWLDHDLIDLAVVNSGQFSQLSPEKWEYIGSAEESAHGPTYLSVCLARKDSGLTSLADLKAAGPRLQVLAVDPLSLSGYINPRLAFQRSGMELKTEQIRFTHSHSNSIRCLQMAQGPTIATLWDSTWQRQKSPDLVEIPIPELEKLHSLPVALVARRDGPVTSRLKSLVASGGFPGFVYDPTYGGKVAAISPTWLREGGRGRTLDRVDLGDVAVTLVHYNRSHPRPARLAVVLAGGGAKCSYQAGAVRALEERLEAARQHWNDPDLDIKLVVGTSGGAINALAVAMGLSKTSAGYKDLTQAWCDLDQGEIVCPPMMVRVNMWCWFAALAGLLILSLNWRFRLGKARSMGLTAFLGLSLAILARLPVRWLLGTESNLQHVWAWFCRGIEGGGLVLMVASLAGVLQLWHDRQRHQVVHRTGPLVRLMLVLAILLPLVQVWIVFFHEEFLSENYGIEKALTRNFGRLIDRESGRRGGPPLQVGDRAAIKALSQEVFDRKLLQRDLVLTASPLTDPKLALPGEFYFYASPLGSPAPAYGPRGVALARRPELLFDALLGSAAIYPLFPSRPIQDLPEPGQSVELVDGSFSHRSPLEPAVLWGATHVLVIEASTQEIATRGSLFDNFGASLCYLYDQAQQVDTRLKGQTVLYTLYPSAPHIGLLDFSPHLIRQSLDKGYREAQGSPTTANQSGGALLKELGPPVFWTP